MNDREALLKYAEEATPGPLQTQQLVEQLKANHPPPRAKINRGWWIPVGLVLAASIGLAIRHPTPEMTSRGEVVSLTHASGWEYIIALLSGDPTAPDPALSGMLPVDARPIPPEQLVVDLRLAVVTPDTFTPLTDTSLRVGEIVIFQVSANQDADVSLWVESPDERVELERLSLEAGVPVYPSQGEEVLAWHFDAPGDYTFVAAVGDACDEIGCAERSVTVR